MAIIIGTDGPDNLTSETAGDEIQGLGGDDILTAIGDNSTLDGGAGDDQLFSFGLGSTQIGGAGNDTLNAGPGADVFQYSFELAQGAESETFTEFIGQSGDTLADNTYTQGFFASQYTAWLEHLVDTFGLGSDTNSDGVVEIGLNQNDPDGTPFIEGVSAEELAGMFTDRDEVLLKTGKVTQERFYSNTFTTGEGQDTVESTDGFDTIVDFDFAQDKLDFDGLGNLTLAEFTSLFKVTVVDADSDGATDDTQLALLDDSWGVSLLDNNGAHDLSDFHTNIFA